MGLAIESNRLSHFLAIIIPNFMAIYHQSQTRWRGVGDGEDRMKKEEWNQNSQPTDDAIQSITNMSKHLQGPSNREQAQHQRIQGSPVCGDDIQGYAVGGGHGHTFPPVKLPVKPTTHLHSRKHGTTLHTGIMIENLGSIAQHLYFSTKSSTTISNLRSGTLLSSIFFEPSSFHIILILRPEQEIDLVRIPASFE